MVLGFNSNPVPGLRKKYDRAREKADKLKEKEKKMRILRLLDQLEPTLIALEEFFEKPIPVLFPDHEHFGCLFSCFADLCDYKHRCTATLGL